MTREKEQSHLSIYRRFFLTGGIRVITGRAFSLVYTIIVARLIAKEIIGIMVVLASLQIVLLIASTYGTRYSSVHFSLGRKKIEHGEKLPIQLAIFIGAPSMLLLTELSFFVNRLFFPSNSLNTIANDFWSHSAYLVSNVLVIILEGFILAQRAALRSDKEETLRLSYSVLNSIFVPLFFYFNPRLIAVLNAWNFALTLSIILAISFFPQKTRLFRVSTHQLKEMLAFGFLVNLATIISTISKYYDKFIIYAKYTEAQLSEYYWGNRIATILFEVFQVSLTGVYPLLTKIQQDKGKEAVQKSFNSLFKLGILTSASLFALLGLFSDLAVFILLGNKYLATIPILQLFSFSMWLFSINAILYARLNSSGSRKRLVQATLLSSFTRIIVLTLTSYYSIHALVIGYGLSALITSIYILSMKNIMLLTKKTIIFGYSMGFAIISLFNILYVFMPILWMRLLIAPVLIVCFAILSYLINYITPYEIMLIKNVVKPKK